MNQMNSNLIAVNWSYPKSKTAKQIFDFLYYLIYVIDLWQFILFTFVLKLLHALKPLYIYIYKQIYV